MNFPSDKQMAAYKKAATPPTIREVVSEQSLAGLVLLLRHHASVACGPEPYLYHSEVKPVNCDKLGEFLNAVANRLECLAQLQAQSGKAAERREAWSKVAKCMDEILVRTEPDSIIHRKALEAQNLADGALTELPRPATDEELPRPATDEEVEAGDAQWCEACRTECMLRGRDILVHGCARHNPKEALS